MRHLPACLRPRLEGLEAVVEPGDGDLGVGGGPRRVDDADEGERVLQHHRDDRGQLQAVGLQHQLQKVPAMGYENRGYKRTELDAPYSRNLRRKISHVLNALNMSTTSLVCNTSTH